MFIVGLLILSGIIISPISSEKIQATEITDFDCYVDDIPGSSGPDDPPEDFTSIQEAINASSDGDTIFVYNGTYTESIVINKSISLEGEDNENTVIISNSVEIDSNDDTIKINTDDVCISTFKIMTNSCGCAIKSAYSNNLIIENNRLFEGVSLICSNHSIIRGNFFNRSLGISDSHYNEIIQNEFYGYGGIFILSSSSHNEIRQNIIDQKSESGIWINKGYNNIISYNIIKNCKYGIMVYTENNEITHNDFYSNIHPLEPHYNGINYGYQMKLFVVKFCKIRNNYWDGARVLPKIIINYSVSYFGYHLSFVWDPTPAREPNCDFGGGT